MKGRMATFFVIVILQKYSICTTSTVWSYKDSNLSSRYPLWPRNSETVSSVGLTL